VDRLDEIQSTIDDVLGQIANGQLEASRLEGKRDSLIDTLKKEFKVKTLKAAKKAKATLEGNRKSIMDQLEVELKELNTMMKEIEDAEGL